MMIYYACEDDGGGGAVSAEDTQGNAGDDVNSSDSDDSNDESAGSNEGGSTNDDQQWDYQSYYGYPNPTGNPLGLSLGAQESIDEIEKLEDSVSEYSPKEYAESYADSQSARPKSILDSPQLVATPYYGAPDKSIIPLTMGPDNLTIPLPFPLGSSVEINTGRKDYGVGIKYGSSIDDEKSPLKMQLQSKMYINFDNYEESKFDITVGFSYNQLHVDYINEKYSYTDLKGDITSVNDHLYLLYMETLNAIGYPGVHESPW